MSETDILIIGAGLMILQFLMFLQVLWLLKETRRAARQLKSANLRLQDTIYIATHFVAGGEWKENPLEDDGDRNE